MRRSDRPLQTHRELSSPAEGIGLLRLYGCRIGGVALLGSAGLRCRVASRK